ncbi:MAG: pyridoxamine 5'-phosphate oxidase [Saprospiraceae bacterium]|nr:pyridoxamine 5'-phosphate oxidase [Saprospiraceae bacterium]
MNIADLRRNYSLESLSEADVLSDPLEQFKRWFEEALNSQLPEPNAMTLATATTGGLPSARTVLLKGLENGGFVFYTNYESRKGRELDENPHAALLFTWLELERQVRIEGRVEKVSAETSNDYFRSRPKGSQIGAWASPQSHTISGREVLEDKIQELTETFKHDDQLPLPPFWGGYVVKPVLLEFWQGRENRLHDRILYSLKGEHWTVERLAP